MSWKKMLEKVQAETVKKINNMTPEQLRIAKDKAETDMAITDYYKKKKTDIELPKYTKKKSDYKLKKGRVAEVFADIHDDENGKRRVTSKCKIWNDLTPTDRKDVKKTLIAAIEHRIKGGSISDFPLEIQTLAKAISKHFVGKGFIDDMNRAGSTLFPQTARNAENSVHKIRDFNNKLVAKTDEFKARQGKGLVENYFKPKGSRQLIYFSDSSSDDEEPHLPVKRGRGRPKKC
jgi:ribonuclease BN (tRNA processing enzyme)